MTFRDAIVRYRAKYRLSMKEFAERCGVSMQTIYNIESVKQNPSRVTKAKILMFLGDEFRIDEDVDDDDTIS